MTRDEILKMPAGKGMDILVAIRIMGWRPYKIHYVGKTGGEHEDRIQVMSESVAEVFLRLGDYELTEAEVTADAVEQGLPPYSTSIESAWEVVEADDRDGRGKRWYFDLISISCGGWLVTLKDELAVCKSEPCRVPELTGIYGDTAALAICRAALLTTLPAK